jgi:small subunit ribosomal protein S19e
MARLIYEKDAEEYVLNLAEALKAIPEFEVPEWVHFVKSGSSRERPPFDSSAFWYVRSASILRQLYIKGVVGVGKLRTRYGSRKNRGGMPSEFRKSGGKIIRVILQQAEKAGFVEKVNRFQHGRRLTEKGKEFLDSVKIKERPEIDYDSLRAEEYSDYKGMEENGKQES